MSGLASLAGYGSDSDDDVDAPSISSPVAAPVASTSTPTLSAPASSSSRLGSILPPPKSGLASKLPPPSTGSNTQISGGNGLSLPPPSASTSNKRKVIKVDSLQSFKDDGDLPDNSEKPAETKKPKLGSASSSKHSLFGMLPAPKRKDDEVLAERNKEADARKAAKVVEESEISALSEAPLRINEGAARSASPEANGDEAVEAEASTSKAKGKSNDAFRAMLGLKPAAKPAANKPAPSTSAPTASIPATKAATSSSTVKQATTPHLPQASTDSHVNAGAAPARSTKTDSAPIDFFSLGMTRSSINTSTSSATSSSSYSISAAPIINNSISQPSSTDTPASESTEEYPGWQLDPDGSWIPITPEAQAQYHAYQKSLLPPPPSTSSTSVFKAESNLDGTRDLLAAGLTPDDIRAFDASTVARDAYLSSKEDGDSDKYAVAAEFAAGNREVQQRKPGMLKGLRKGQLSSLVNLANENRGRMEEKWQRGRDAQARRSNQYGW